ncbi:MAG: ADP-ribosylglycohydrolase family protein [Clostridiales bacterium]|nr:ADP-ribosylglycohydrolase family protein [Clostridiales bacterium]
MDTHKKQDKFLGCLIGGAAGDALGYAVEFDSLKQIYSVYGKGGIREYSLEGSKALISDDTQMTLFTANGLLHGFAREVKSGVKCDYPAAVWSAYRDWLKTQCGTGKVSDKRSAWLLNMRELHSSRAPGSTCLSALSGNTGGSVKNPVNDSKGCGGVMRVAPIGLFFIGDKDYDRYKIDMIGAEAAALTHGHDLGYIPAAALTDIIYNIASEQANNLKDAVVGSLEAVKTLFPNAVHLNEFTDIINLAIKLSSSRQPDTEAIMQLGEGWVGEEALAIAVYCALKYSDSFEKAIIASVNHSGDSDSTGAITGNILGAYLGLKNIPEKFITKLEMKPIIHEIAVDLSVRYSDDEKWKSKYIDCDFVLNAR